jgi:hypothetical protein
VWTRCSTHAQATKLRHVTLRVRAGAAAARAARSECCTVSRRRGTAPQPQGAAALIEEATAMAAAGRRRGHTPGLAGGAVSRGGAEDRLACEPRCAPAEPCAVHLPSHAMSSPHVHAAAATAQASPAGPCLVAPSRPRSRLPSHAMPRGRGRPAPASRAEPPQACIHGDGAGARHAGPGPVYAPGSGPGARRVHCAASRNKTLCARQVHAPCAHACALTDAASIRRRMLSRREPRPEASLAACV